MKSYVMKVNKVDKAKIGVDKIGGNPTYKPTNIPEAGAENWHFLMEIYNKDENDSDIICWQFYQGEFGGPISEVIEIHKGAELYNSETQMIKKRRWIDEYEISYEKMNDDFEKTGVSMFGGNPGEDVLNDCKEEQLEYIGVIYTDLCPYNDLNFGYESVIIGKNKDGKIVVI